jgi:REP element-mobilizing transposase RayT
MRLQQGVAIIGAMYRPRIEMPGGFYHVGTRGNNKQPIFLTDDDRASFLRLLARTSRRHGWSIHAYVLMTNHYHLVLQLREALSRGMCELNGGYALMFNSRHGRSNHLFGKRFWDAPIETDAHHAEACRYVVLNPLRAGLEQEVGTWPWSSYRATAGLEFAPSFLAVDELLAHFGPTPATARDVYIRYVLDGQVRGQPLRTREQQPPARRRSR